MKRKFTSAQALEAFSLHELGQTLDEIREVFRVQGVKVARSTLWRAIREVTDTRQRIDEARRTGNFDLCSVAEALAALTGRPLEAEGAGKKK